MLKVLIFLPFTQELCHLRKVREKHIDIFISFSYNMLKGNIPFNYVVQEECKLKLKKRVMPMLAGVLVAIATTITASAHPYDYWQGKYIGKDGANILLRIGNSAQTDLLNYDDVYKYGFEWNHISSKVNVSIAYNSPGMPSLSGEMHVVGKYYPDNVTGETIPYDSNGNIMTKGAGYDVNGNWARIIINMNTDSDLFNGTGIPKEAARKTFVHEVGHALKLCHPFTTSKEANHTYEVYIEGKKYYAPKSVMNQGAPTKSNPQVASTVVAHDRSCIIEKWGG